MTVVKTIEEFVKERQKCTFNVEELIYLIDGGVDKTNQRKKVEGIVLNVPELRDPIPEVYLSYKERYENIVRKVCLLTNVLKETVMEGGLANFGPSYTYKISQAVTADMSPFMLHVGMFLPTLMGQADDDQMAVWLPKAIGMEIIGTYAQTELGHGTFLRGLETTATYDPSTEEFILHSPSITAYKWWPGGLGCTANHAIVVAQLYTKSKNHGVHPFIVQLRDLDTHMPLPGIKVGEIGPKMGFQTANNGFLGFDKFRIPRNCMLMKNSQVLKDGTYVKSQNEKASYGTMVFVRVIIVNDMAYEVAKAATIAVRYSVARHQSQIKPDEPEPAIIEYVTQQHKLFIAIATSHALRVTGLWLWKAYNDVIKEMSQGNLDVLPELHAVACCLKAVSTKDSADCVEQCRLSCGGHGYMLSSSLPIIYSHVTAANTYEGENTVLLLQTARFLVKAHQNVREGKQLTPNVAYMLNKKNDKWQSTPEGIIRGMQAAATGKINSAVEALQRNAKILTKSYEEAWNMASVQLVAASEAHCRAVLCDMSWRETQRISGEVSKELGVVLNQLAELYLVYWALQKSGDLLLFSNITGNDLEYLRTRYEELLALIRPNALGLVDSFDIRDEILNSTLGAYDGRVYERLMEEALKSPLNQEPVNQSFHQYLKPFMQGKL